MTAGRPRKEIDKEQFESLCALQCTQEEIAGFFHCSDRTISHFCKRTYKKTFEDAFADFSANGKMSLRRYQWKSAQAGNVTMQIWLGKQWLGQTDKVEQRTDATVTENQVVLYLPDNGRGDNED
jgi:hypothetical protein